MPLFTEIFLIALITGSLLQYWLLQRHLNHVAVHRDRVPEEFAERITLSGHHKAADYTRAKGSVARFEILSSALLLLLWTLGGGLDLVNGYWLSWQIDPIFTGVLLIFSVFFISSLLDLPFSLWRTFRIEANYGFNRTTLRQYIKDRLLGAMLSVLLGAPLTWVVLWLMQSTGQTWWLAAWLVWMAFTLLLTWAYPRVIAPLFNRFTPLQDGETRERILNLLQRCGFTSNGIFVMDGSRRSSHGNAYFTGFGNNKRVVFFDTLLESLSDDEMEAVLAHELGHFRLRHIYKQLILNAVLSLGGLALLGWLSRQSWFYQDLGVSEPSNALALILFILVMPVFTLFFAPFASYLSRHHEFEADAYAVTQTGGRDLINALVKLYRENANTLTPDPLYSMFHDSHPPALARIAHINQLIRE
ncbi:MAG: M48 family metallopeptidase [Chromatiales bacterium]|jgi:STE24 endopeptidase